MNKITEHLFLIVGTTGSGKTTIADSLCSKLRLTQVESCTDRPKRTPTETGHRFLSESEYDRLVQTHETLAPVFYGGHRYCVTKDMLDNASLMVVEPSGVEDLKRCYDEHREIVVIGVNTDKDKIRARMTDEQHLLALAEREEEDFRLFGEKGEKLFSMCDVVVWTGEDPFDMIIDYLARYVEFIEGDRDDFCKESNAATLAQIYANPNGFSTLLSDCCIRPTSWDITEWDNPYADLKLPYRAYMWLNEFESLQFPVTKDSEKISDFSFCYPVNNEPANAGTKPDLNFLKFVLNQHIELQEEGLGSLWTGSVQEERLAADKLLGTIEAIVKSDKY